MSHFIHMSHRIIKQDISNTNERVWLVTKPTYSNSNFSLREIYCYKGLGIWRIGIDQTSKEYLTLV